MDPEEVILVSTISTLEIARLVAMGFIEISGKLSSWVRASLDVLQCGTLEISHEIALEAYALPGSFHKDPADRILAASARLHDMTLVTADDRLLRYRGVRTRDARR